MRATRWARLDSQPWTPPAVRTVVVCPHPDDEVLAAGGLIIYQRRHGVPVAIVAVTDGEASYETTDRQQLAARRRAEQCRALAVLGVGGADVVRAGVADGAVVAHEDRLAEFLAGVVEPGDLVVAPWEFDFHADHEACGRAAGRAARRRGCPVVGSLVWGLVHTDPDVHPPGRLLRLSLDDDACADRRRALAEHRSQIEAVVGDPVVIPELAAAMDERHELYVDVETHRVAGGVEAEFGVGTTSEAFFEAKYRRDGDPWDFARSPYEQDRYRALVARIGARRWRRIYEPGCSIGELTRLLASVGDEVVATDIAPTAVAAARQRCHGVPHVNVEQATLPGQLADGPFDLIVFSELGYYFDVESLTGLVASLVDRLEHGGTLLAVHWTGTSPDHVLSGATVHDVIDAADGLHRRDATARPGHLLGEWERVS